MSKFETIINAQGRNGNIYSILGAATSLLNQLNLPRNEVNELRRKVLAAQSYKAALKFIEEYFPVEL